MFSISFYLCDLSEFISSLNLLRERGERERDCGPKILEIDCLLCLLCYSNTVFQKKERETEMKREENLGLLAVSNLNRPNLTPR